MSLDCEIDDISCGNNHVVVYNKNLGKIFFWGSNNQGQIDVFKKQNIYKKPKALSLEAHIDSFMILARGDSSIFLCDSEIQKNDLEMTQVPQEDILGVIHELGSKNNKKNIVYGIKELKK